MKMLFRFLLIALLPAFVLVLAPGQAAHAVDISQIEKDLQGEGVVGWVHGAVGSREMYVFTYRNPNDFFDFIEMSMLSPNAAVEAQLAALNRNDQVRIKGSFLDNPSPQKHIMLSSVEALKKYSGLSGVAPYKYVVKLPNDLERVNRAVFLVHAVAGDGQILVVEFKDQVIPIFVQNPELTKGLSRNDMVRLKFHLQKNPDQPTHLMIDETTPDAVEVMQSIAKMNGQPMTVEGALVLFPKSPEIMFNVFAVLDESPAMRGYNRQFTIVNMDDPKIFKQIRDLLQAGWDRHPDFVNGRNKLFAKSVRVKVTGIFNEVDPGQANAQILVQSISDLSLTETTPIIPPNPPQLPSR